MTIFSRFFSGRAAAFACAAMLATGASSESVLFSENFSQAQTNATNQSYPVGLVDNTGLSTVAAVPEPAAFAMFCVGLGLLGMARRRVARPRGLA